MRNYIILNNQSSNDINGLIIQELAPISKPQQRTQVETIDGRDGDIVTSLGYAAYNKKIKIGLYGDFDINEIIAYFATQGTAIFSNEPDKYYNYQILDQIDYERLVRYRVATVSMHIQPFKYSATEGTLTIDASDTVTGEGSDIALDNTAEAPFNVLRHKGNATQATYSGQQLYNYTDLRVTGSYLDVGDDGWYTFTADRTNESSGNYYSFSTYNLALNNSTSYAIVTEIASVSITGTANITPVDRWGQFETALFYNSPVVGTYVGTRTTKSEWGSTEGLVSNVFVGAGSKATIKFRISVIADTSVTPTTFAYEPYVGGTASPNPVYPQDISLLTGDSTITIDDGGENSQEYVIPFGDTYLAAIGDYADEPVKVGDTWYIRHKIGKVVLDGTETGWSYNSNNKVFWGKNSDLLPNGGFTAGTTGYWPKLSDYFTYYAQSGNNAALPDGLYENTYTSGGSQLLFHYSAITSLADFKAWLAANTPTVYYALATPTDEEITEQALIDALDDFYEQAHAYRGRTHITASAQGDNAPAILAVEVNQDNETTVTNAGNTTSRPILTIYGQGDIGLYINDVQVLDIALGDEQYITIDSVAMEAYKDTTENLKNRLVTGDYNKLALNAGANKIYFTGNVTKYEISKYSRWL